MCSLLVQRLIQDFWGVQPGHIASLFLFSARHVSGFLGGGIEKGGKWVLCYCSLPGYELAYFLPLSPHVLVLLKTV